ncbi:hypothetical protein [Nonomuraea rhodomycinica]|uniref:Uncharacterized protein n=1 Tax=Nonomuraea rhodomycinica TaxID=1712872 RepID=A0A7Y6IUZ7_9ACTN|nr:hypothetical protein [Nonomuraea rhodomycinica]NUW44625.1 hypothetical protein [Nonomuraea rhodomycinica]
MDRATRMPVRWSHAQIDLVEAYRGETFLLPATQPGPKPVKEHHVTEIAAIAHDVVRESTGGSATAVLTIGATR